MLRVFNCLVELLIIKLICGCVLGIYDFVKEKSIVVMIGLSVIEVLLKVVGVVVKVFYIVLFFFGLVGCLKGSFEKKGKF